MLKREEYLKTVRRPYPPLFCSLVCLGYSNPRNFKSILKTPFAITNMAHVDNYWYYSKAELDEGGKLALMSWRDQSFFNSVQEEFERRADILVAAGQKSFENFCHEYQKYMPALIMIFAIDKPVETALREALSNKLSDSEAKSLMDKLNVPLRDNIYRQEEYELFTTSDLAAHVEKYRWLLARYGEEREYTLSEAQNKLRGIDKGKYFKKRNKEKEALKSNIVYAKKLLVEEAYLIDIFQYVIYYRTHRTDIMNKSAWQAIPMLKARAGSLGLTYEQFLCCSAEELLTGKIPVMETLESRIMDCSTLLEGKKVWCVTGQESRKIIDFFREDVAAVIELKGVVACGGWVKGVVKLVYSKDDFRKIKRGDILVTSMTTPDMISVMQKAVAFVTDEGGVTCHAAIISREMKKPCIIGTKIATQVLKDGDLVEVDAEKGVVRILKMKGD